MSKKKKICYYCKTRLSNQTATQYSHHVPELHRSLWVDCCHGCKAKQNKKP